MQAHVSGVLHNPLMADLQFPDPLQGGAGPSLEMPFPYGEVVPVSGVQDRRQRPQQVIDADPNDNLVPVNIDCLVLHGDKAGPVGERQTVDDLHGSG